MGIYNFFMNINMSDFPNRLKLLRSSRNITQARLAKLLKIDARAYNRWERGGNIPHLDKLVKIADILQITLDELVGRSGITTELKIRNNELRHLCEQADNLPDEEQNALILVMNGLITNTEIKNVIAK